MKDTAPPINRGEGPLNSRGNILIPVLIAFAVVSSLYVASTILMNHGTALHQRIRIGDDIDIAMSELKAQLLTPGLCDFAFYRSDNTNVIWNPVTTPVDIDHIKLGSTLFWTAGAKLSPVVTLESIKLRQPDLSTDGVSPSTTPVTRRRYDTDSATVAYTSHLAKLIVTFKSGGLGGARKARSIYVNVQVLNSSGRIEHCYPATGMIGGETNKGSFLNEMGTICNSTNSPGCTVPGCTKFALIGFDANGAPNCVCTCMKDILELCNTSGVCSQISSPPF